MAVSAVDVVSEAFEHTKQQLFKPFRLGQWTRLGIVGLLAGEITSTGGCSTNYRVPTIPRSGGGQALMFQTVLDRGPLMIALIAMAIVVGLVLLVAFLYISSTMRFVLFDSVVTKECHVRRFWRQRTEPGFRYFVWQLVVGLISFAGVAVLVITAAIVGFAAGWLRAPREHILPLVIGGLIFLVVLAVWLFGFLLIHVLTKDFVVPQMAVDNVTPLEGWRRLWTMMDSEKGRFAGYVGMKVLLSIGAFILSSIAALVVILAILVPVGVPAFIAFLVARTAGIGWNALTLGLAIALGTATLAACLYAVLLITVPLTVFFPAYSMYFFAARYPSLNAIMNSKL